MLKRLFDVLASLAGLLALAPLFIVLAVLIKRDSPGPVFYRQTRVGRYGKPFDIHKFRTMTVRQPGQEGLALTVGQDNRVTRVGAVLRHYKIDELPQLIDVLKGDMSLVGPRPEVPKYVDCYPPEQRTQVLSVRPGITDLASIEFRHENQMLASSPNPEQTYIEEVLPIKLRYYCEYVQQQSLLGDLRIIWRTLFAIVGK